MNGNHQNGHSNSHSTMRSASGDLGSSPMVRATEGWLELFLTPPEKYAFSQWQEVIRDRSLVHQRSEPFVQYLATWLPDNLAPNVITLFGFLSLGQAWYLVNQYGALYPMVCTILSCINVVIFFITTELTRCHAQNIRQLSALSDLFKYSCDTASTVWLTMLTVYLLGGTSVETLWYAVQATQLVLLLKHLSAFKRHAGLRYRPAAGPGEVLLGCFVLLSVRAMLGLDGWYSIYSPILDRVFGGHGVLMTGDHLVRYVYYGLFVASILQSLTIKTPHGFTRYGLTGSLLMRFLPAVLLIVPADFEVTVLDVICDGFFVSVLTSDLILAKMSSRELHPWVILMSLATVLSHSIILMLVTTYYIAVFSDLCFYLNLPLLATCRNVYCDGVYDLCHIGHKRAFQNALALGNRLLVGVMGDEDCAKYKRPPIMTHAERCAEVEACKAVTQVIPNAPCFGVTQDFLDRYQIHAVAFGEEYLEKYPNPDDDPYYGLPRRLGIGCPLPRTNALSTTELITRIQKAKLEKNCAT